MTNKYYELIHKMIAVNRMHKKAIDTAVDNIGVQRSKHQILMIISKNEPITSQKQIADKLGVSPASVTGSLGALERDGLIKRTVGKDSRYNEICVTERGREIVDMTRAHFCGVDAKTFEGLSDSDIAALEGYYDIIYNNLKKLTEVEE